MIQFLRELQSSWYLSDLIILIMLLWKSGAEVKDWLTAELKVLEVKAFLKIDILKMFKVVIIIFKNIWRVILLKKFIIERYSSVRS